MTGTADHWAAGDSYESYMGRWSRLLACSFVRWLKSTRHGSWLELGCGTGALTRAICKICEPASVIACDPSESFIEYARSAVNDGRVSFMLAGAEDPPGTPGAFDCVVSGLVLNFVAEPAHAVRLMGERARRGGVVGAYVWDYGEGMEFLRRFWDEAVALDATAEAFDEGRRFPLCGRDVLGKLFASGGLKGVAVEGIEVPTRFRSFEDFWLPFLRGTGPAPSYVASLSPKRRELLRGRLSDRLKATADGTIQLKARAWAVRGVTE